MPAAPRTWGRYSGSSAVQHQSRHPYLTVETTMHHPYTFEIVNEIRRDSCSATCSNGSVTRRCAPHIHPYSAAPSLVGHVLQVLRRMARRVSANHAARAEPCRGRATLLSRHDYRPRGGATAGRRPRPAAPRCHACRRRRPRLTYTAAWTTAMARG